MESINNKRYSTNLKATKAPGFDDICKIFEYPRGQSPLGYKGGLRPPSYPPIFDLASGLSYKAYSDIAKLAKKGHEGFGVNVYDNGELIKGSPAVGKPPDGKPGSPCGAARFTFFFLYSSSFSYG